MCNMGKRVNFLLWPWTNLGHRLIIANISWKLFVNPTRGLKDKKWTRNTVIQCLILNCDLDVEQKLVKHRHCTSSHQGLILTLTRPCSNIGTAHRFIILDICVKLFVNPTRGSKDIERTRNTVKMFNLRLWPWPWIDFGQT